ncbi:MAG: hypothetical protein H5U40_07625, partial [Polyangiaceae bacterium]|nr:hypothetical protein [Polyangiaceae bacterium]
MLETAVALGDPLRTPDMRRDRARRTLRRLREKDDAAWYAVLELASLAAAEGRVAEAVEALRLAVARFPRVPGVYLTLADLLLSRGWDAESDAVIAQLATIAPSACTTIDAELGVAQRRERTERIAALAERSVACDARSNARFTHLLRARRWDEAKAELERIASLDAQDGRIAVALASVELAEGQGNRAEVERILSEVATRRPRAESVLVRRFDVALASGDRARALNLLSSGIEAEPASFVALRQLAAELGGNPDVLEFRRDGIESVRGYLRAAPRYEQPQVLVLDYNAVRIYPDGSNMSLVHQVVRVQSEEAVDAHGEFSVPEGAYLLRLRTIKRDGTVLEPDLIEGKETISLPSLAVGDFVESEMLIPSAPSLG